MNSKIHLRGFIFIFFFLSLRNRFSWYCGGTCVLTVQAESLIQSDLLIVLQKKKKISNMSTTVWQEGMSRGGDSSDGFLLSSPLSCWSSWHVLSPLLHSVSLVCIYTGQGGNQNILTGYAHRGLSALGGPQVAPGHTLAPVVLGPMEILHLLPGDVDKHLPDLQACKRDKANPLRLGYASNAKWRPAPPFPVN